MGCGTKYECEKCGYTFGSCHGYGYLYPSVYKETVEKAKNGELGDELREFFKEHPDGAINAENVTLCCDSCGHLDTAQDLTMYVPVEDRIIRDEQGRMLGIPSRGGLFPLSEYDMHLVSDEYAKYPHKCKKCGSAMRIVSNMEELKCPKCKIPLKIVTMFTWD